MSNRYESIAAVDLGGTNCKVWHKNNEIIITESNLSDADEKTILTFIREKICTKEKIRAIGIAISCTMVPEKGDRRILSTSTKFSRLSYGKHRGVIASIEKAWAKELKVKVSILNDGEAASVDVFDNLCSKYSNNNYKNVLVITLGTSIGAGFIFNGKPYFGPYPSRASHIILDPRGDWCSNETHKGCWKTLVGDKARSELAFNMGLIENRSQLADIKHLLIEAGKGSKRAQLFFRLLAEYVAKGIATIINIVPVQCVVISGGVSKAGNILIDPLRERLGKGDLIDVDLAPLIDVIHIENISVARGAQIYTAQKYGKYLGL